MGYVFWGMACVLLDIPLELGDRTVGLLPDWLGYWWLAKGFGLLEDRYSGFRRGQVPALVLAVFSAGLYIMDLLALSTRGEALLWGLGLAAAAASVVMARLVSFGVCCLEEGTDKDQKGGKLRNLWVYLAVMRILAWLFGWLPLVGAVCSVASAVMSLCWLAALWDARKRYDKMGR